MNCQILKQHNLAKIKQNNSTEEQTVMQMLQNIWSKLERLEIKNTGALPVIPSNGPKRLLGMPIGS